MLEEFTYHPVEERVFIKEVYNSTGSIIETTYYINQNYVQVINLSGTFNFTYYYVQGTLVAQDMNGIKSFFANDQKGNVVTIMNSTGSVVDNISYGPFGDILSSGNNNFTLEAMRLKNDTTNRLQRKNVKRTTIHPARSTNF